MHCVKRTYCRFINLNKQKDTQMEGLLKLNLYDRIYGFYSAPVMRLMHAPRRSTAMTACLLLLLCVDVRHVMSADIPSSTMSIQKMPHTHVGATPQSATYAITILAINGCTFDHRGLESRISCVVYMKSSTSAEVALQKMSIDSLSITSGTLVNIHICDYIKRNGDYCRITIDKNNVLDLNGIPVAEHSVAESPMP